MKVEWKKIGEIGSYFGGLTGKTKEDFEEGNAKFITYMNVYANPSLNLSAVGVVKINDGEKQNKVQQGDILFTGSSETPDDAGLSCVVTDKLNEDFYMNSFCFGLRPFSLEKINLHFLKHLFRSTPIRKSIAKTASGVTRFNISKTRFGNILIPLPTLAEQARIVGILDTFSASIENLKEQIAQRRKQYEHYRDKLLDLEGKEGVEMKTLGEVCDFQNGFAFKSSLFKNKGIPIIRITNIDGRKIKLNDCMFFDLDDYPHINMQPFRIYKNDILIAMSGATTGKIGIYDLDEIGFLNQRVGKFIPDFHVINYKYLYHFLIKQFNFIYLLAGGGAQPNLSSNKLMKECKIPLPSLQEQSRIVSILDTFEASIANLEAQLKERQKQYEYYRNKLLTFEE